MNSLWAKDVPNGNFDAVIKKAQTLVKTTAPTTNKNEIQLGIELLSLDYSPFMTHLNRKIKAYNFRDQSFLDLDENELSTMAKDSNKGVAYANDWSGAVKNNKLPHTGMLGWGFYTANNPQSSAHFSNSDDKFALVTMDYPKGAKIFDTRAIANEGLLPISDESFKYLSKLCNIDRKELKKSNIEGYHAISKVVLTKSDKCNQIFSTTLDNFKVDAIAYQWDGAKSSICDSKNIDKTAFINVNGKITNETTNLFINPNDEIFEESIQISEGIKKAKDFSLGEKTYLDYAKLAVDFSSYDLQPFKDDIGGFYPKDKTLVSKFQKEIKEETFGCSKIHEKADAPTYKPEKAVKELLNKKLNEMDPNALQTGSPSCKP